MGIKRHFFREEDMYRVAGLDGFRYTTSNGMGHTTTLNKLEINHGQLINDKNSGIKNYPISITAKGVEARGYCGSPWIANNLGSRLHCIVGIHAWCVSQSMIGATPVTQEMLQEGVEKLAHLEITTRAPTIPIIGNTECISMTYKEHGRVAPEYAHFSPGKHDFKPTTEGNILSNKILSRIVFMIITHLHASLFTKHCGAIYMGDDNTQWIHDISEPIVLKYNRQAYAEVLSQVGMTVTNPDKSEELTPFDSFEDITFLKQGFSDVVRVGCYLPTMSLETVGNLTNWYRKGGGPQQPIENLKICLEFLAPYGQETFNEFRAACLENDKVRLYEPDLPTFWRTIYGRFLSDENVAGKLSLPSLSEPGSNLSNLAEFQS